MPKKKVSKKSPIKVTARTGHDDLPATVGLVKEVRSELMAEIRGVNKKVDSVGRKVDALERKMDSRFDQTDSRFDQTDSRIEQVIAGIHRTQALMEEQRGENKIVLDGIKALMERQDRVEEKVESFDQKLQALVRAKQGIVQ